MDSDGGLVEPTSTFVPREVMELFNRVGYGVVGVAALLFAFLFVRKFMFYLTWRSFRDGPYALGFHQWRPGNLAGPQWCNICESIVYGIRSYVVTCDICGMYAHAQCAATTMKYKGIAETSSCACKTAAVTLQHSQEPQRHLWIKGNIDPMDTCSICGLFCGSILALSGMKCAWCHIRVHENCFQSHAKSHRHHFLRHCDFGRHHDLILPPSAVILNETPSYSSKSRRALSSVKNAAQIAVNKMSNIRLRRATITNASGQSPAPPPRSDLYGSPRSSSDTDSSSSVSSPVSSSPPLSMPLIPSLDADFLKRLDNNGAVGNSSDLPFEIVPPKDSSPLLVFINSRSGGQMGLYVLRQIRKWLNPLQVYDLSHQTPIEPLLQFKDIPRLRILVCGGDGTVGWVLSALDEIGGPRQPPIAILPLGTGNDLARVLGWGSGFSTRDVSDILTEIAAAHVSLLDRWQVNIGGKKRAVLNNYLGVGVDAQVALEFHEQRERSPGLFMSQFVNKLWYSQFGAKNFLVRTCAGLPSKIELECDGKIVSLPPGTEGVILLNINSYGGGSKLWHDESDSEDGESDSEESDTDDDDASSKYSDDGGLFNRLGPSSPHDGLLDVVAVYGTLHLGQMQVGLSKAVRLCQAKSVKIRFYETLPIQIDGEPWQQPPCEVNISFLQQAFMLSRTVQERDFVTRKVGEVLDWAENTRVITSTQRDVLLAEIARRVADETDMGRGSSTSRTSLTARRDLSFIMSSAE
ncbi:Diacylglycerol kinase, partial [Globisporangium splendens]